MSFQSTWGTIFKIFDPDNPRHVTLHAHMVSVATSDDTILVLNHLVSALRRFPSELLAKIFAFCVADAQVDEEPGLDVREAPWVLGQVCDSWRTVALSTPQLWWKVDIHLDTPRHWSPRRPQNSIYLLALLLERSGKCPITVRVLGKSHVASHPALDMLMKESHRWEDVWLYLSVPLLESLAPIKGRLRVLRNLEIYITPEDENDLLVLDAFEIAPLLDSVEVAFERSVTVLLPSAQLRYYSSVSVVLSRLASRLNSMRNLVICHIHSIYCTPGDELLAPSQIHLPRLRTLVISEGQPRPGVHAILLDSFTVPELDDLKLRCSKDGPRIISHSIAFVLRSSCSLRKFALKTPNKIPDELPQFFEYTPALAVLTLTGALLTRGVAQKLTRAADSLPGLLPMLQTLLLDTEFPSREVVKMVRSRIDRSLLLDGVSDAFFLEELAIKRHPRMGGAVFDSLFEMKERGLTVEVLDEEDSDECNC
ncbi:hypothetical protein B0H19DRAFT_1097000 [Mycena capillaripes]|nr:hypothetical protein B0H19DRAFT_1097000 [Mycena capillaripes]